MTDLSPQELAAVVSFLERAGVDVAGPVSARLLAGGRSNLTFRLEDGVSRWVMRMPPRVGRTPSAHDVAREYRVTQALIGSDVPVPPPVALCEDDSLVGSPFAVAGFVEGRSVQSRGDLDALDDATVTRALRSLVETLAALHRLDHVGRGLSGFGRPGGYAARQIHRWTKQWDVVAPAAEDTDRMAHELSRRLHSAVPEQRFTGLVHGDYRIDNTLLRIGPDRVGVAAVLDWELSTIGDPIADVALMATYRNPALDLVLGAPTAWTSGRLLDADGLAAAYERAGGVPLDHWNFHLALAHFKLAVIAAGIDHRYRMGATTAAGFDRAREAVAPLFIEGLRLLRDQSQ